jgi:hypothetical protein
LLDVSASAKLKIIKAREQSMQTGGAHGAYGVMGPPNGKAVHGMMAPSIFGFPITVDPATLPPRGSSIRSLSFL